VQGPYTVARAIADYVDDCRRRGGKAVAGLQSVVRRNVLPDLGTVRVAKLTTRRLLDCHRAQLFADTIRGSFPRLLGTERRCNEAAAQSLIKN
jgi:hypothetical protein